MNSEMQTKNLITCIDCQSDHRWCDCTLRYTIFGQRSRQKPNGKTVEHSRERQLLWSGGRWPGRSGVERIASAFQVVLALMRCTLLFSVCITYSLYWSSYIINSYMYLYILIYTHILIYVGYWVYSGDQHSMCSAFSALCMQEGRQRGAVVSRSVSMSPPIGPLSRRYP